MLSLFADCAVCVLLLCCRCCCFANVAVVVVYVVFVIVCCVYDGGSLCFAIVAVLCVCGMLYWVDVLTL